MALAQFWDIFSFVYVQNFSSYIIILNNFCLIAIYCIFVCLGGALQSHDLESCKYVYKSISLKFSRTYIASQITVHEEVFGTPTIFSKYKVRYRRSSSWTIERYEQYHRESIYFIYGFILLFQI